MKTLIKPLSVLSVIIVLTGCAGMQGAKPATSLKATVTPVAKATHKEPLNDFLKVIIVKANSKAPAASALMKTCGLENKSAESLTQKHLENLFSSRKTTKQGTECWAAISAYPEKLEKHEVNKIYAPQIKKFEDSKVERYAFLKGRSSYTSSEIDAFLKKANEQIAANEKRLKNLEKQAAENSAIAKANAEANKKQDAEIAALTATSAKTEKNEKSNTKKIAALEQKFEVLSKTVDANKKESEEEDTRIMQALKTGINDAKNFAQKLFSSNNETKAID
jgi:hypothetical protein